VTVLAGGVGLGLQLVLVVQKHGGAA